MENKKSDKENWYKKRGYEGILKVDYTPNSELAKRIKSRIEKEVPKSKIMIQELAGKMIKSLATNSKEPWKNKDCGRNQCYQCLTCDKESGLEGRCWSLNSTYSIQCLKCRGKGETGIYIGESKDTFQRHKQHADAL